MPDDESPDAATTDESARDETERDESARDESEPDGSEPDGSERDATERDDPSPGYTGRYEAVLFDLGGVIIDLPSVRASYVAFLTRFAEREGVDDVDGFVEDWRSALGSYFSGRDGTEYRSARDGYEAALEETLGREVDRDEWLPLFREATEAHSAATQGAIETVRALADRGCYLGVVSDIDHRDAEQTLDRYGIRDCFDSLVTSEAVGRTKPDPAMYEAALEDLPCDPSRALYVGDRYEHDMQGGTRAGFATVAYGGTAAEHADRAGRIPTGPDTTADASAETGLGADVTAIFDLPDDADHPRAYRSTDEHVAFVVDDLRALLAFVE